VAAVALTLMLPATAVGQTYFAFVPLPRSALLLVLGVVAAYVACAELMKRWFFRRFEP
jgi:hypothetical protein